MQVRDNRIEVLGFEKKEGFVSASGAETCNSGLRKHCAEHFANGKFVVDDQDSGWMD
jgi:hypothetical protein